MPTSNETSHVHYPPSGAESLSESVAQYVRKAQAEEREQHWHLSGTGPVQELESKLQQHYGFEHALCVSSATTGIHLTFRALDLAGDPFITTPYTWGGTVTGPLEVGARPVFADVDADTLGLDPGAVRRQIEKFPEARALLAVDVFGVPSDTWGLRDVAEEHDLWYIADAAQSFGARIDERPASAAADVLVTSFTAGKALFAGEGGAVLTDNRDLYERLVWISQHPLRQKRELGLRLTNECALNGRIHPVAAIMANETFNAAQAQVEKRRSAVAPLIAGLNEVGMTVPIHHASLGLDPSYIRVSAELLPEHEPEEVMEAMEEKGWKLSVETAPVRLVHTQPVVEGEVPACRTADLPGAKRQARRRICVRW